IQNHDANLTSALSERHSSVGIEGLNLSNFEQSMAPATIIQDFRFQEIVPLSAGNVLVSEDNEPAAKWLALINQALNKPSHDSSSDSGSGSKRSKSNFFHKPSLKVLSRNLRADASLLKACDCHLSAEVSARRRPRKSSDPGASVRGRDPDIDEFLATAEIPTSPGGVSYRLIASKQMVGIFVSIWARKELVQHVGHLRISTMGRGIMGRLGNKGCISISMSFHQTSFCFVCSHLASGEKEGDELRRNADVAEILKSIQFPKICKNPSRKIPERIIDHE
ncbi:hypothetical protein U1Q18_011246, partial [Sarracenia purpurea var. burkii]